MIFVEHTPGSALAKKMRIEESKWAELTGYRVKIIEKAGDRFDRMLIRSDAMEGAFCEREDCRLCWSKAHTKKKGQPCTRRSATYKGRCLQCKKEGRSSEYIGETGADLYSRSKQHHQLWLRGDKNSWMMRHYIQCHLDVSKEDVEFCFEAIEFHSTAFERRWKRPAKSSGPTTTLRPPT